MRAITCTDYGRPTDVLVPADVDPPTLEDDQVLVVFEHGDVSRPFVS